MKNTPKPDNLLRVSAIMVRVTEKEKERILRRADKLGLSLSSFARMRLLEREERRT